MKKKRKRLGKMKINESKTIVSDEVADRATHMIINFYFIFEQKLSGK